MSDALADFPVGEFDALQLVVGRWDSAYRAANGGAVSEIWRESARSGNAVKVRWIDLANASDAFAAVVVHGRDQPEHAYLEESTVFTFFFNALSALEMTFFHMYAMGACVEPRFTLLPSNPRGVTPGQTRIAFDKYFPGETISAILSSVQQHPNLEKIKEVRNILSHRGTPTRYLSAEIDFSRGIRHAYIGGPLGAPAEWKDLGLVIQPALTIDFRSWLSTSLTSIFTAARPFAEARM